MPTNELEGAERLARYLTRGPLPIDVVEKAEGGRLRVRTPPDPATGLVEKILDPHEGGAHRRRLERTPPGGVTDTA